MMLTGPLGHAFGIMPPAPLRVMVHPIGAWYDLRRCRRTDGAHVFQGDCVYCCIKICTYFLFIERWRRNWIQGLDMGLFLPLLFHATDDIVLFSKCFDLI
mmetsp:Transcript_4277/g.5576  ORF Transcript_4277/g.5576 Transcript_4277/m.5576 type:complete len:100 (+) Transcript_4277:212-511(+)